MTVIDIRTRRDLTSCALNESFETNMTGAFSELRTIQRDLANQMKALLKLPGHEYPGLSRECATAIGELSKNLAKLSSVFPKNERN